MPKDALDGWIKAVGEEEAERIKSQAGRRGTVIHEIAERYVLNEEDYDRDASTVHKVSFAPIKKTLDAHLSYVRGIEVPLYSKVLRTAGRTDLVGGWKIPEWDRPKLAVIDFKTSRGIKTEEDILGYFLQKTAYAFMYEAIYKERVEKIVTVMTSDATSEPLVWVKNPRDYREQMLTIFRDRKWQ